MANNPFEGMEELTTTSSIQAPTADLDPFAGIEELAPPSGGIVTPPTEDKTFLEKVTSPIETLTAPPTEDLAVKAKTTELRAEREAEEQYKTDKLEPVGFTDILSNKKYTTKSLQGMVRHLREDQGMSHGEAINTLKSQGATPLDLADAARYISGTDVSGATTETVYQPMKDVATQIGAGLAQVTLDALDFIGVDTTDEQAKLDYVKADSAIRDEDYREKYGIASPAKTALQGYAVASTGYITASVQGASTLSALSKTAMTEGLVEYIMGRGTGYDKSTAAAQAVIVGTTLGALDGVSTAMTSRAITKMKLPSIENEEEWIKSFSVAKDIPPQYRKEFEELKTLNLNDEDIATILLRMRRATDGGDILSFEDAITDVVAGHDVRTTGYLFEAIDNNVEVQNKLLKATTKRSKDMQKILPAGLEQEWKRARNVQKGDIQATNWKQLKESMEAKGLDVEYPEFFAQVDEYAGTISDTDMTMFNRINTPTRIDAPTQMQFTGGAKTNIPAQLQAQAVQAVTRISPTSRMLNAMANYLNTKAHGLSGVQSSIATMVEQGLMNNRLSAKDISGILKQDNPNITTQQLQEATDAIEDAVRKAATEARTTTEAPEAQRAQEVLGRTTPDDAKEWENYNQYMREKRATSRAEATAKAEAEAGAKAREVEIQARETAKVERQAKAEARWQQRQTDIEARRAKAELKKKEIELAKAQEQGLKSKSANIQMDLDINKREIATEALIQGVVDGKKSKAFKKSIDMNVQNSLKNVEKAKENLRKMEKTGDRDLINQAEQILDRAEIESTQASRILDKYEETVEEVGMIVDDSPIGISDRERRAREGGFYIEYKDDPIPFLGGQKTYRDLQRAIEKFDGDIESTEITKILRAVDRAKSKKEVHQILKAFGVAIEDIEL